MFSSCLSKLFAPGALLLAPLMLCASGTTYTYSVGEMTVVAGQTARLNFFNADNRPVTATLRFVDVSTKDVVFQQTFTGVRNGKSAANQDVRLEITGPAGPIPGIRVIGVVTAKFEDPIVGFEDPILQGPPALLTSLELINLDLTSIWGTNGTLIVPFRIPASPGTRAVTGRSILFPPVSIGATQQLIVRLSNVLGATARKGGVQILKLDGSDPITTLKGCFIPPCDVIGAGTSKQASIGVPGTYVPAITVLFEDPIVGFEDPIVGFEDPILKTSVEVQNGSGFAPVAIWGTNGTLRVAAGRTIR